MKLLDLVRGIVGGAVGAALRLVDEAGKLELAGRALASSGSSDPSFAEKYTSFQREWSLFQIALSDLKRSLKRG